MTNLDANKIIQDRLYDSFIERYNAYYIVMAIILFIHIVSLVLCIVSIWGLPTIYGRLFLTWGASFLFFFCVNYLCIHLINIQFAKWLKNEGWIV